MTATLEFTSSDMFYDDLHFPHGFKKCGNFSIAEAELLTTIGKRLLLLEQGSIKPENAVEVQFVAMCQSRHEPQTKIEKLWHKYKRLTKPQPFHGLGGQT